MKQIKNLYNKQPLVTIVIPCYNYAEYVGEAIVSVINQTYSNIELIVINDGSTDNSDNVIKKLLKKYNFKYINQHNQGIIAVRNKAINIAKGEYLVQLDADDAIPTNYVNELVKSAQKDNGKSDIFYTPALDFNNNEKIIDPPVFNIEILKHYNFIHASAMVKTRIIKKYQYDKNLESLGLEDWDMYLNMCLNGVKAMRVDSTYLIYRSHGNNPSRTDKLKANDRELQTYKYILTKQISSHPLDINYLCKYLQTINDLLIFRQQNMSYKLEVSNLSKHIKYLQKKISRSNHDYQQLSKSYNGIIKSNSWKLTKPLRGASNIINKKILKGKDV